MNQAVVGIGIINDTNSLFLPNSMGNLENIIHDIQIFCIKAGKFLLLFGVL